MWFRRGADLSCILRHNLLLFFIASRLFLFFPLLQQSEKDLSHLALKRFLFITLLVALVSPAACTHIERLKRPFTHRVDRRVRHKEIVRIDDRVYVKVPNPDAQAEGAQMQYLYVSVDEYLANRETFDSAPISKPSTQEEEWRPVELETASLPTTEEPDKTGEIGTSLHFKKRLMIVPFRDSTNASHKKLADRALQTLISKIRTTSDQIVFFDAAILEETLRSRKLDLKSFESPETIQLANQLFNVHAIVTGTINHLFTSSTESKVKGKGKTTYAIAEISAKLFDAASGSVVRVWEKRNPTFASEGKGDFSEEKAQLKAIEWIISEIGLEIIEELRGISWHTTIASVDGDRVYISAGKLSGVRVGDVFSVYPAASQEEPKGEVRVGDLFGIDSSVADITRGKGFRANDVVRPTLR